MRSLLSFVMLAGLSTIASAQPIDISPTGMSGHHIGETASSFLAMEPKTQLAFDSCRREPLSPRCDRVLGAFERGQRAEITTSDSTDFVFDQGRLIKLAKLVDGTPEVFAGDLTKTLGPRASEIDIQKQDQSGAKWNDNLSMWAAPDAYILLFEDNNPNLGARRPVLVVESPAEHARNARNASDSSRRTGVIKRGLQQVLSKSDSGIVALDF
jgi:hypothetical protein